MVDSGSGEATVDCGRWSDDLGGDGAEEEGEVVVVVVSSTDARTVDDVVVDGVVDSLPSVPPSNDRAAITATTAPPTIPTPA